MGSRPMTFAMAACVVLCELTRPSSGDSAYPGVPPEFFTSQVLTPRKPGMSRYRFTTPGAGSTSLIECPLRIQATRLIGFHVEPTGKPLPPPSIWSTAKFMAVLAGSLFASGDVSYILLMPKPSTSPVPGLMAAIITSILLASSAGMAARAAFIAAEFALTSIVV